MLGIETENLFRRCQKKKWNYECRNIQHKRGRKLLQKKEVSEMHQDAACGFMFFIRKQS